MTWSLLFFTTNIFLGIGLAMDAFSVSMANGLNEPHMNKGRVCTIAGVFGGFQALMPLIGWFCVHTIAESFHVFEKFIPWIALILLLFIGGKMLIEGIKNDCEEEVSAVSPGALFVQGIATSIDALSVGFTIAEYNLPACIALHISHSPQGLPFTGCWQFTAFASIFATVVLPVPRVPQNRYA